MTRPLIIGARVAMRPRPVVDEVPSSAQVIDLTPSRVRVEYWVGGTRVRRWVPRHRVIVIEEATG